MPKDAKKLDAGHMGSEERSQNVECPFTLGLNTSLGPIPPLPIWVFPVSQP